MMEKKNDFSPLSIGGNNLRGNLPKIMLSSKGISIDKTSTPIQPLSAPNPPPSQPLQPLPQANLNTQVNPPSKDDKLINDLKKWGLGIIVAGVVLYALFRFLS